MQAEPTARLKRLTSEIVFEPDKRLCRDGGTHDAATEVRAFLRRKGLSEIEVQNHMVHMQLTGHSELPPQDLDARPDPSSPRRCPITGLLQALRTSSDSATQGEDDFSQELNDVLTTLPQGIGSLGAYPSNSVTQSSSGSRSFTSSPSRSQSLQASPSMLTPKMGITHDNVGGEIQTSAFASPARTRIGGELNSKATEVVRQAVSRSPVSTQKSTVKLSAPWAMLTAKSSEKQAQSTPKSQGQRASRRRPKAEKQANTLLSCPGWTQRRAPIVVEDTDS